MAKLAVFGSGNGTNFEAIAERLSRSNHEVVCVICDRADAPILVRAERRGIPAYSLPYSRQDRSLWEAPAAAICRELGADLIALAGFMRLLTSSFVDSFSGRILNIHPSLLPRHPGVNALKRSFESQDEELGVTVHFIDHGLDTGPIIAQSRLSRSGTETLEQIETSIHNLEHQLYPEVVFGLLEKCSIDR